MNAVHPRPDPLSGISLRLPTANLEAEQSVLGALLANNKAFDRVSEFLRAEHFADATHGAIYAAIQRRVDAGQIADAVTLRAQFESDGTLADVGGASYLGRLLTAMVGHINVGEYGRVIEDAWLRRQAIDLGEILINRAFGSEPEMGAREILEAADDGLMMLSATQGGDTARTGQAVASSLLASVTAAVERRGALPGVPWGFRGLNAMTGGLRAGQFVLLGGRPSMGKTSLGLKITQSAAEAGHRVLFISAEMKAEQVMARAVAAAAGVPMSVVTRGGLEDASAPNGWRALRPDSPELGQVADAAMRVGDLPVVWDDGVFTVAGIRARARRMLRQPGGLGLIVIDYLSRLRASSASARQGNAAMAAVNEISAGLKDMAMQLGVPVLLLSQLNRQVEARDDKTPMLSDLRDSGALEQDADLVLFLHRPHYYLVRTPPTRKGNERAEAFETRSREWQADCEREVGRARIIVAKQRQGPVGPVRIRFDDSTAQFSDEANWQGGD
jgi:replicative DNA helicase